ncbi:hypothetical protein Zm00014a_043002 [Zea mays]|uniref:Uncharacterized protein n=1 Tax=Zea mays TaxID=4577 RepID=A0A3L6EZQ5_MAIZE|nr:hypothetical protein Zm00014a_043002 [Zea mays]
MFGAQVFLGPFAGDEHHQREGAQPFFGFNLPFHEGSRAAQAASSWAEQTGGINGERSEIAEIEAASTGEVARLTAALEEMKGELAHLKGEHAYTDLF